jgi:hypothetical protein
MFVLTLFNIFSPWWWICTIYYMGIICVLLANAVCILDQERFFARIGWAHPELPAKTMWQQNKNLIIRTMNAFRTPAKRKCSPKDC